MKFNKLITILAASSLAFSLAACGDDDSNDNNTENKCDCEKNLDACNAEEKVLCDKPLDDLKALIKTNLAACDLNAASPVLDLAWTKDKNDADVALSRAIVNLFNIVHHEKIQGLLSDFGFKTASVDFSYLWNDKSKSIFKQFLSGNGDWNYIFDNSNHKCVDEDEDCVKNSISKTLTIGQLIEAFMGMEKYIVSMAESFEAAAKALEASGKESAIDGAGCGLGEIKFTAADLYGIASALNLALAAGHLASAYSFDMKLYDLINVPDAPIIGLSYYKDDSGNLIFDSNRLSPTYYHYYKDEDAWQAINSQEELDAALKIISAKEKEYCDDYKAIKENIYKDFLKVKNKDAAKPGRSLFVHGLELFGKASANSDASKDSAIFAWNKFNAGMRDDVAKIVNNVAASNNGEKAIAIPQITPVLSFTLTKLFDNPPSATEAFKQECKLETDTYPVLDYNWDTGEVKLIPKTWYELYSDDNIGDLIKNWILSDNFKAIFNEPFYTNADQECIEYYTEKINDCEDEECKKDYTEYMNDECYGVFVKDDYSSEFSSGWGDMDESFLDPQCRLALCYDEEDDW